VLHKCSCALKCAVSKCTKGLYLFTAIILNVVQNYSIKVKPYLILVHKKQSDFDDNDFVGDIMMVTILILVTFSESWCPAVMIKIDHQHFKSATNINRGQFQIENFHDFSRPKHHT